MASETWGMSLSKPACGTWSIFDSSSRCAFIISSMESIEEQEDTQLVQWDSYYGLLFFKQFLLKENKRWPRADMYFLVNQMNTNTGGFQRQKTVLLQFAIESGRLATDTLQLCQIFSKPPIHWCNKFLIDAWKGDITFFEVNLLKDKRVWLSLLHV